MPGRSRSYRIIEVRKAQTGATYGDGVKGHRPVTEFVVDVVTLVNWRKIQAVGYVAYARHYDVRYVARGIPVADLVFERGRWRMVTRQAELFT